MVRASDCGSEGRGFETRLPPSQKGHQTMAFFFCSIQKRPSLLKVFSLNVLNQLANIYTILEQYHDAVKIYNQLIELDPEDHLSWSNKGANLMKSNHLEDAYECFITSIEINSNNFDAYYNLACLFAKSNEPKKVIINLKNAQSINPSFKIKDSILNDPDLQSINQHKIIKDYISFSQ